MHIYKYKCKSNEFLAIKSLHILKIRKLNWVELSTHSEFPFTNVMNSQTSSSQLYQTHMLFSPEFLRGNKLARIVCVCVFAHSRRNSSRRNANNQN